MRGRYHVERRPGKVYNTTTGRLCNAHVVVFVREMEDIDVPPWLLPGEWTHATARHIARTSNAAMRNQSHPRKDNRK